MASTSSISSKIAFLDDYDEEQEEEEQMRLTCVLVVEYLSSRRDKMPTFYVRDRL